jgi:hypothetical protein
VAKVSSRYAQCLIKATDGQREVASKADAGELRMMRATPGRAAVYYAKREARWLTPDSRYIGVSDDPDSSDTISVAIPFGVAEARAGDLVAVFSLVVDGRELPERWTCRARRFVRVDEAA